MATRLIILRRFVLVGLGILVLRLGYLQLWQGQTYRQLAEKNRLRLIPQSAPRGLILDRAGRRLATSRTVFRVAAVPQDLPADAPRAPRGARRAGVLQEETHERSSVFARLGSLVNLPAPALEEQFNTARTLPFLPATLVSRIPKTVALRIEEERVHLPGILVESVVTRHYPLGSVAAHLLGYVGKPSAEAFPVLKQYGVRPQDLVGRAALEQELDAYLRGRAGGSLIEVNHRGRQVRVLGYREPIPGEPVVLTIDAHLQALIEQQFGQQPGACVVLQPKTGEVLAMVSIPSFEPEAFATQDQPTIQHLLGDPNAPLMNRATLGVYLPGSIAKLVTAMTALEHQVITPTTPLECRGQLVLGDRAFHCWNRDGHGVLTLRDALTVSCNVYFMQVGRRVGLERLRAGLSSVGFGRPTGWRLQEQPGFLPGDRRLSEGEVALLSIGQGGILVTPLQVAIMVSAIANQGWLVEPWVVKTVGEHSMVHSHLVPLGWSAKSLAEVQRGMLAVVNDPQGTGIRAHSEHVRIAGKTGTAQTHLPGRSHGWFVGFCPAENPIAAMAIVAEYGGSGGEVPATIGKAICEYLTTQPDVRSSTPPPEAEQKPTRGQT